MWQEHILETDDGQLLWAEAGSGPPLVFLHGGPGDEYRYLKVLAEPLLPGYRCILFDQRGSGGSTLRTLDESHLHPDRFVGDIEVLRRELSEDKITLIGHSWGGILALLYGSSQPERVAAAILIGLGPLSEAWNDVARANRIKGLSPAERDEFARLTAARRQAIAAGDSELVATLNRQRFRLSARAALYDQEQLDSIVDEWLAAERYRNWQVNRMVWTQIDFDRLWQQLPRLQAPLLVLYGYQDFEPITQGYHLQQRLPGVELAFVNEAGHLPWLEQPDAVDKAIKTFLAA